MARLADQREAAWIMARRCHTPEGTSILDAATAQTLTTRRYRISPRRKFFIPSRSNAINSHGLTVRYPLSPRFFMGG